MSKINPAFPRHALLWSAIEPKLPKDELAHDAAHVLRVYVWALHLAPGAGANPDLAGAAALVHDLIQIPKDDAARPLGGERSAGAARPLLEAAGYEGAEIDAIGEAVRRSSWSRGLPPSSPLDAVLQDADRLDAIGAHGIARVFACAQSMARPDREQGFHHPEDPDGTEGRTLDDRHWALDHFALKLLRLAEGMHLPAAREEARRRHALLARFAGELAREARAPGLDS